MDGLRKIPNDRLIPSPTCSRCQALSRRWDQIAGQACCPNCVEALAQGEGDPLVLRTEPERCVVCEHAGTVRYLTFPLYEAPPVEMDLCPEHLRDLLGRRLRPPAFQRLRGQLHRLGLTVADVFLLHEAFYDANGQALQPAVDPH